jgi:hypothetical protein
MLSKGPNDRAERAPTSGARREPNSGTLLGAPLERRVRRLPARTPFRSFRKRLVLWEVVCDFVPGCLGTDEDMTRRPHSRIILKCAHR